MMTPTLRPPERCNPGEAERHFSYLDEDAQAWLRLTLRHKAHGCDLRIQGHVESEDCALLAWWAAGWIEPDGFAPDLAQRSSHGKATAAHYGLKPMAYWWRPGPKAEEGLALLPKVRGLAVGDKVRYAPTFLRNIGMSGDRSSKAWRAVYLAPHRNGVWVLVDEAESEGVTDCPCGDGDPSCELCKGKGRTSLRHISKSAVLKVRS